MRFITVGVVTSVQAVGQPVEDFKTKFADGTIQERATSPPGVRIPRTGWGGECENAIPLSKVATTNRFPSADEAAANQ